MARRRFSLLGSVRKKIWAILVSLMATGGTSLTAYFWDDLVGLPTAQETTTAPEQPKLPNLVGQLTGFQKAPKTAKCDLLGCDVTEENKRITVVSIKPGTPGALLGLVPGDVIEKVDNHLIDSPEILETSLARSRIFLSTEVRVKRGDRALRGEVHLNPDLTLSIRRPLGN